MISYVRGELAEILGDVIVVECSGVGYNISVPTSVTANLPSIGSEIKVYTYMNVKEDEMSLFGFLSRDDLGTFKMLISVNGIGPKVALGILSNIKSDDLKFAVLADDTATIKALPGIGPKTAQRIIIELKDKFKLDEVFELSLAKAKSDGGHADGTMLVKNDAVEALVALGYSSKDALKAVNDIDGLENMDSEAVLKEALKKLALF